MPAMSADPLFHSPTSWEWRVLGDVCSSAGGSIQTGPFGSQLHASDYADEGIPSIMPQNIGDNRIETEGIARITDQDATRLAKYRVQPGDIIYSRRGDVEKRALVRDHEDGWLCGTGCLRVRLGRGSVDPDYAAYYLGHPSVRGWIVQHAIGATMPNLNTSIMSAVPFLLPPLAEQRAIAVVLGALDDKIELNRRMNRTLEEMARALFKAWFVDFEPVRAKMAGRAPASCDAETARLFPDRLVPSELGLIPEGWRVQSIADLARYVNGRNFTKGATGTGKVVVRIRELNSGVGSTTKYNDVEAKGENTAYPGDILFSWSGSLGLYRWHDDPALVNQHIFKVIPNQLPAWYVYLWLGRVMPRFQRIAAGKATTMGHIQRGHLSEALLPKAPDVLIGHLSQLVQPMYDRIHANEVESRSLGEIRETLLPKLISGRIRVRDSAFCCEDMS